MKKFIALLSITLVSFLFLSMSNSKETHTLSYTSSDSNQDQLDTIRRRGGRLGRSVGRRCYSEQIFQYQLKTDLKFRKNVSDIERMTQRIVQNKMLLSGDSMIVPVVVNVLYRTPAENISDAQIKSQIDVLNEDFRGTNSDVSRIPSIFQNVKSSDIKIRFVLSKTVRKLTTKAAWSTNGDMKKSAKGGIDPTTPTRSLNIWVCTLAGGILGYAQFPGGSSATDGVVILNSAFGSKTKCPKGYFIPTYNLGRTATHEVGHWFNLRHIWGDAVCGDDLVGDTPKHNGPNYGCPTYPKRSTCTGTPVMMTMNYMDYTDDACMYMFTAGQRDRMKATFVLGGPRAGLR